MDYDVIEEEDDAALQAAVRAGIRNADPADVRPRDWRVLSLGLRTNDGSLVGGVYGATMWGWLLIDGLWVAEELRGRGLGRRLMLAAESAAMSRGCRGAWLGTFD